MTAAEEACRQAFEAIADALNDIQAVYRVGFSCSEAEALYEAMVAVECHDEAKRFMSNHADLDDPDEGDLHRPIYHHQWTDLPVDFERI
jgi:hypothetical protein